MFRAKASRATQALMVAATACLVPVLVGLSLHNRVPMVFWVAMGVFGLFVVASLAISRFEGLRKQDELRAYMLEKGLQRIGTEEFDTFDGKSLLPDNASLYQTFIRSHERLMSQKRKGGELGLKEWPVVAASILAYAQSALGLGPRDQELVSDSLQRIQMSARYLIRLSELESSGVPLQEVSVDVDAVVEALKLILAPEFARHGNRLIVLMEAPLAVKTDETRLKQILLNLLVEANQAHEGVSLTLSIAKGQASDIVLKLYCEEDPAHPLGEWSEGWSLLRGKEKAVLIQGELSLEEHDELSMVVLRLPEEVQNTDSWELEPSILWVEDDAEERSIWAQAIRRRGYRVSEAESSELALEIVRLDPPDLLLLDHQLPGKSGLAMMETFKEDYPDIPIILVTGSTFSVEEDHRLSSAGVKVLQKPFKAETLWGLLEAQLGVGEGFDPLIEQTPSN